MGQIKALTKRKVHCITKLTNLDLRLFSCWQNLKNKLCTAKWFVLAVYFSIPKKPLVPGIANIKLPLKPMYA